MLNKKVEAALNAQINYELFSSYLYLSMATWFESRDLPGFANWMFVQAKEELLHVERFYRYINERDGRVTLTQVEGPRTEWESALNAFQEAYEHEQKVSGRINDLVSLTQEEKDNFTQNFLQWFITEQVEEEASVKAIVQQLKLMGDQGQSLFLMDRELGQRVFTPPPAAP